MHDNIYYDVYNTISKSKLRVREYSALHHTSIVSRSQDWIQGDPNVSNP